MDDSLIRSELAKAEKRLKELAERYERESGRLEAEVRVYRNLLRIADGTKPKFAEWLEGFLADSKLRKSDLQDSWESATQRLTTGSRAWLLPRGLPVR